MGFTVGMHQSQVNQLLHWDLKDPLESSWNPGDLTREHTHPSPFLKGLLLLESGNDLAIYLPKHTLHSVPLSGSATILPHTLQTHRHSSTLLCNPTWILPTHLHIVYGYLPVPTPEVR